MDSALYTASLVDLLVGLTGVGGGSLMTPLLVLLFGSIRRLGPAVGRCCSCRRQPSWRGARGWRNPHRAGDGLDRPWPES